MLARVSGAAVGNQCRKKKRRRPANNGAATENRLKGKRLAASWMDPDGGGAPVGLPECAVDAPERGRLRAMGPWPTWAQVKMSTHKRTRGCYWVDPMERPKACKAARSTPPVGIG